MNYTNTPKYFNVQPEPTKRKEHIGMGTNRVAHYTTKDKMKERRPYHIQVAIN